MAEARPAALRPKSVDALWRDPRVVAWALYDWANSAFALSVLTVFVPLMLGGLWNDGAPSTTTTFRLGLANGLASAAVVLLAPLLGALTDGARTRKPWLLLLTAAGVACTAALGVLGSGQWLPALLLFGAASVGFFAANSLYDAMLMDVASPRNYDRVSSFGYAVGYLGGALLFTLNVMMLLNPSVFGLASADAAVQAAFVLVAVWWAVFTVPLLTMVDERHAATAPAARGVLLTMRQLKATIVGLRQQRNVALFLLAYWFYIDGVYTIIKMAVDYGLSRGIGPSQVTTAILLTNFIGFPASLAFGWISSRIGERRGLYLALGVYIATTIAATFLVTAAQFYALAIAIGLVQGGVQSLSRSLFARLVSYERRGEYFGFFNLLGKFSSVLGPVLAGTAALLTGSQRFGILSILVLFVIGAVLLRRVTVPDRDETA